MRILALEIGQPLYMSTLEPKLLMNFNIKNYVQYIGGDPRLKIYDKLMSMPQQGRNQDMEKTKMFLSLW